jgi:subfamily B ATP-binding cassette protein MsbA
MTHVTRLLSYSRPYWLRFAVAVFLMAVVGACEGLTALMIRPVFDQLLKPDADTSSVLLFEFPWGGSLYLQDLLPGRIRHIWSMVAVAFIGVTLVKGAAEYLATYFMNFVGHSAVRDLRNQLYARIIQQSIEFFTQNSTGRLMSSITSDVEKIQNAVSQVAADFLKQCFTLVGLLAVVFMMDWKLALASMLLIPFVVIPAAKLGRRIRISSRQSQDKMAEMNNVLQETFSGIRIVKGFVMEAFEIEKFKAATRRLLRDNMRWVRAHAMTSPLMEILGAVTIAGLLLYARNAIIHNAQTTGGFVAFLYALLKLYEPIKRLTGVNNSFQQAVGASEEVFRYLDIHSEVKEKPQAIPLPPFRQEIVFEGVGFEYEGGAPILQDVDLRIGYGEVVAIVGSSGAGKTTLANLIPRFFDVTRGRIVVDGHDVRDVKLDSLRGQIALVTQETILFNDTVFNNICYGRPVQDEKEVVEAAQAALAHDFIMEMPHGYQTLIGERGQRLSGGQRQRIAIARALYKNAPVLILDEATSELDTESELLVQRALNNLMAGRTVVVIAHRLSTVRRAHRIVVLDRGTVSEMGTHDDLVNRGGIYQRLHELQFVDAEP